MKVSGTHVPPQKRNITFNYDIRPSLAEGGLPSLSLAGRPCRKVLRRVPHVFGKTLELPFDSEANVSVQENRDCFRFALITNEVAEDIEAHFVQIVPGVSKILIRGRNFSELSFDELEVDVWRYRLPPSAKPELATASYTGGQLIVTVPKHKKLTSDSDSEGEGEEGGDYSDRGHHPLGELSGAGDIRGGYSGAGGGGASANRWENPQEPDWKVGVGRSNISRLQPLVLAQ